MNRFLERGALGAVLLVAAVVAALVPAAVVTAGERQAPTPDPDEVAARAALEALPLADRAAQLVMTSVPGVTLSRVSVAQLRALRPGGIIVFRDNYRSRAQLVRWTRATQLATLAGDARRPRALVSVDQEGGVVKRIPDAAPTRSHPQLGVTNRPALTRSQARATAATLRALGIQLDLAPVADLDLGPNHVMRDRSFGGSPTRTGAHVAAFVEGLRDGGGASAVKHFPGFGGASVNSDDAIARITRSRAALDLDLAPFRAAIDAKTDAVMVSHGIFTALDQRQPASVSPAVYRVLREDLGYRGIAITDSLHARGFTGATRATAAAGCARSIIAGADIALLTGTLAEAKQCRDGILAAVRAGTLTEARVDEAALRVLTLKSRVGLLPQAGGATG